jgi:hypothetical protein
VNTTGWLKGLRVTADGTGIVSHAGVALVRALAAFWPHKDAQRCHLLRISEQNFDTSA